MCRMCVWGRSRWDMRTTVTVEIRGLFFFFRVSSFIWLWDSGAELRLTCCCGMYYMHWAILSAPFHFFLYMRSSCQIAQTGLEPQVVLLWLLNARIKSVLHQAGTESSLNTPWPWSLHVSIPNNRDGHSGCRLLVSITLVYSIDHCLLVSFQLSLQADKLHLHRERLLSLNTHTVHEQLKGKAKQSENHAGMLGARLWERNCQSQDSRFVCECQTSIIHCRIVTQSYLVIS